MNSEKIIDYRINMARSDDEYIYAQLAKATITPGFTAGSLRLSTSEAVVGSLVFYALPPCLFVSNGQTLPHLFIARCLTRVSV